MQYRSHPYVTAVLAIGFSTFLWTVPVHSLAAPLEPQSSTSDSGDDVQTIQREAQQQYQAMGEKQQEQAAMAGDPSRSTQTQDQGELTKNEGEGRQNQSTEEDESQQE
ncbi:MAG TPA: hypothetical protein VNN62_25755 [Methylomirabilota bacterium]|nr:hypothetical protein [Methylomirabilota bacterium]